MIATLSINKKTFTIGILLAIFWGSLFIMQVQAAANDSSITLKKDTLTGFFVLTVKDPDGIQEFSMKPAGKLPYGGGMSGCLRSFTNDLASFDDPSDFEPTMTAYVIDCKNNTAHLELAPPKNGFTKSTLVVEKEEESSPPPSAPTEKPKEEKKGGLPSANDIIYPVHELGDCQSEAECRSYCDNSQRAKECFVFAKKYNLVTKKEAERAENEFFNVKKGPGGCNSGTSCEAYCNNVDRLDECIAFAEDSGYYSGDELAEAKKFQELVKSGKQFPGSCKDRNACELYCNTPQHMEECLNFAEESGFMPKEEIEQARKVLSLMQRGETPGGCTSKEQCEKYCFEDSHSDECIAFGEKAGLISPEDAAMVRKTGGKGPGGCRSKEQCEAYCENNSDECFQWAEDNGLVSEADLTKMKEGMSQFKEQLDKIPPEVTQCLKDAVGEKNFDKLVNGEPIFDRGMEGKMKSCFNQLTSQVSKQFNTLPPEASQCIKDTIGEDGLKKLQSGEFDKDVDFSSLEECFKQLQSSFGGGEGGGPGGPGGGGFAGPGGCKSIDECTDYCQDNPDECQKFTPPGGGGGFPGGLPGVPSGKSFVGPGNCATPEECIRYCQEPGHEKECEGFKTPSTTPYAGGAGPGGCGSVEECRDYCHTHPDECGNFISDETPSEPKCQSGFEIAQDNKGMKYCAKMSCHEGEDFITDFYGRRACSPATEACVSSGTQAEFVCGRNGRGAPSGIEVTYFNSCIAKEHGAEIIHEGVCKNHVPCADVADPVCGTDAIDYVSACYATEHGATVAYQGTCKVQEEELPTSVPSSTDYQQQYQKQFQQQYQPENQQQYPQSQPTTNFGGPGGCKTAEECQTYCMKNYQDPTCRQSTPAPSSLLPLSSFLSAVFSPLLLLLK